MNKNIIFVEHGGKNKEFTLKKAKGLGLRIILATTKFDNFLLKYVNEKDVIIVDTYEPKKLIASIFKFIKKNNIRIDAVISFKESSVIPTSILAEKLGLSGVGSTAAQRSSQNKLNMRTILKNNNFKLQPKFIKINIFDKNFKKELRRFPKPCVIKPLIGSSSHGVKKISNNENIDRDIGDVKKSIDPEDREIFKKFEGSMLVEEYIKGKVISVDGIVIDHKVHIVGTTEFIMGKEPYFQQIGSFIPANIPNKMFEICKSETTKVIDILGFNTCGFHCEWRIKEGKPYLLEIASRTVGGGIPLGYKKVTGVDLTEQLFYALLKKHDKIKLKSKISGCVLHKSILPKIRQNSILTEFKGYEKIKSNKNIWHSLKFASVGDKLLSLPQTPTQLYYYALRGKNLKDLIKQSREIESDVSYKTIQI